MALRVIPIEDFSGLGVIALRWLLCIDIVPIGADTIWSTCGASICWVCTAGWGVAYSRSNGWYRPRLHFSTTLSQSLPTYLNNKILILSEIIFSNSFLWHVVTHLLYVSIIKIHPNLQFRMEKECRIMFAVVGNDADEFMFDRLRPSLIVHVMEHITQTQRCTDGFQNSMNLIGWWSFRVPNHANRHHIRTIQ